jgi:opacity protein-like surface antigen
MKIKIILSALIVLFFTELHAQDYARPEPEQYSLPSNPNDRRFNIGVSIGAAIPLGDYGSTNVKGSFWDFNSIDSTRLQGFAQPGLNLTITASYLFPENIGIMMMFGSSSSTFNTSGFSSAIGRPATTSTGSFSEYEYLIGPCFELPLSDKFRMNANILIGLVSASYPEVNYAYNDTVTLTTDFQGGTGFGYSFGANLEYNISKNAAISLNVNYIGSDIKYTGFTWTLSTPGYYPLVQDHPTDVLTMQTGILKITAGITFRL